LSPAPRFLVFLCTLLGSAAVTRAASADDGDVALQYTRRAGAQHCPDEGALRSAVLAHLGYDPFAPHGQRRITVTVGRTAHGLHAQIESLDARGAIVGARSLDSHSVDCRELVSSVALAVSIAIDPLHATATAPPVVPASPAPSPEPVAPPPPPVDAEPPPIAPGPVAFVEGPATPSHTSIVPSLGAAFVTGVGFAPAVSFGGAAEVRLRPATDGVPGAVSIGLGGRADAPTSAAASVPGAGAPGAGARVQSSLLVGTFVPCWHHGILALCAAADLGALAGTASHVLTSETHSTFFAAVGARANVAWPVGRLFALGLYAEALVPLTQTTLRIDHEDVWSTSTVAGDLGLQVSVQFP
jgi:hypothetical protein